MLSEGSHIFLRVFQFIERKMIKIIQYLIENLKCYSYIFQNCIIESLLAMKPVFMTTTVRPTLPKTQTFYIIKNYTKLPLKLTKSL